MKLSVLGEGTEGLGTGYGFSAETKQKYAFLLHSTVTKTMFVLFGM